MTDYQVVFARSAGKELARIDRQHVARILTAIETLAKSPRPSGCRELVGSIDRYRIRIGDYRIIYALDDQNREVDVIHIRHRSDAYR